MIKAGDTVKLRNPRKKGEAKRRWVVTDCRMVEGRIMARRIDTATHRREQLPYDTLVPLTFWERLKWRIYG